MEIAPGIHMVKVPIPDNPLGYLNCYLIEGKEGWLMVDTGWHTQEALNVLRAGLKEMGLDFTDIATIVLTHVHSDHFGLAGRIRQFSPNTRLLAHQWETALIESHYIKFADLRQRMAAMLSKHGVPLADVPALESASMPALGEFGRIDVMVNNADAFLAELFRKRDSLPAQSRYCGVNLATL